MQARVRKWGNSLGIRIPRLLAQKAGLTEGVEVDFQVHDNAIIISPKRYTLESLLARVTPENLHEEVNTGQPTGREAW
ncbi:MAG: AbrB/MazE/SpoVT family DNA-binding domain-containing protein [Candidatus Fermentithermobacillus carboniphilus]|uniref:AbrB/MazE/SpoVT family DNA-binding domain-containing protein n=1 Tax=Candidatus Fermentithermobacillus carboniphilus TaxID=3085328 RepID=A0AAT9LEH2_9FIRM|nr:MAG: AbrB/MazE/SpoVT family DNA-binding domain-containing protein [Candidatus Fermentithermobacillus carboniphilus]